MQCTILWGSVQKQILFNVYLHRPVLFSAKENISLTWLPLLDPIPLRTFFDTHRQIEFIGPGIADLLFVLIFLLILILFLQTTTKSSFFYLLLRRTIWLLGHSWDDWILNINRFFLLNLIVWIQHFWKLMVLLVRSRYVNLSIHLQVHEGHTQSEAES